MKSGEGSKIVAVLGVIASLIAILGFATGVFTWDDLSRRLQGARGTVGSQSGLGLEKAPPDLSLRVIANVPQAAIYLNGKRVGQAPANIEAHSGYNEIMVVRPGCSVEKQRVETNDIRQRLLRFNLDCVNAWLTDHPAILRDVGECPFEGCTYREWLATKPSVVRVSPQAHAKEVFRLEPGEWVTAVTGEVVTQVPGLAVLDGDLRRYCGEVELRLRRGDSLHLYSYHGEGSWLTFYNGEPCDGIAVDESEVRTRPVTEWWVKVVNASGDVGWVRAERNFDNWDVFS